MSLAAFLTLSSTSARAALRMIGHVRLEGPCESHRNARIRRVGDRSFSTTFLRGATTRDPPNRPRSSKAMTRSFSFFDCKYSLRIGNAFSPCSLTSLTASREGGTLVYTGEPGEPLFGNMNRSLSLSLIMAAILARRRYEVDNSLLRLPSILRIRLRDPIQ